MATAPKPEPVQPQAAEIELNEDPRSTYGATEAYKEAWHARYGKSAEEAAVEEGEVAPEAPVTTASTPTTTSTPPTATGTGSK